MTASARRAIVLAMLLAASGVAAQDDRLRIVTTTTALTSLAEAVGGRRVAVTSLAPPGINAEDYQPRPQDLQRIGEAKLLLRVGADYDLWVDRLVARALRPDLWRGGRGYVDCSFTIALLEVRGTQVGPGDGHAHGNGNPHYWLDPRNAGPITGAILGALARNDPANAEYYEVEREGFLRRLEARLPEWEHRLAPLQGQPLVAYHNSWPYFARRFRLNFAGYIEPRPGIPPPPSHLAALVNLMADQRVKVIVRQPHEPARDAEFLAARTGAKVALLAASVGAVPQAGDYLALFDYNVEALAAAFR